MKKYIYSFLVVAFVFVAAASAAAQGCPQVAFLMSEGEELGIDGQVSAYFTGSKKIPLDTFTYTFKASAGKITHETPTSYYMKIDTLGLAPGTRIDVQVTAKRGSCSSQAKTWAVVGAAPKAVAMPAAPVATATPVSTATCPTLVIEPPVGGTSEGAKELLMARVQGGSASIKPEIKWSTTAGKGEMTTSPTIAWLDTTGVPVGTEIGIFAEAVGYGCTVKGRTTIKMVKRDLTRCPTVSVSSPDTAKSGVPFKMTAVISGGDKNVSPTFNWTVSAGFISSGQGTATITIDTTGVSSPITATSEVGGYAPDCRTSASSTTMVEGKVSRKFDEFGAMVNTEDQYARLDNLTVDLQNDPTSRAVLLFYAGRKSRKGAIEALTEQTKKYLTARRGIPASRIVLQNGGFRENGLIEMWVMPQGAEPPTASPTVDPSEAQQLPALKPVTKKKA